MFYIIIAKSKINKECSKYKVVARKRLNRMTAYKQSYVFNSLPLGYKLV